MGIAGFFLGDFRDLYSRSASVFLRYTLVQAEVGNDAIDAAETNQYCRWSSRFGDVDRLDALIGRGSVPLLNLSCSGR